VIRKTPITGDPVILAPDRDERPNVYEGAPCPFCPGAESQTPAEIARDGDPWRVRVFANKYPATAQHEVIVESPDHDATFDQLSPDHAARAVEMMFARYRALRAAAPYVCLFKNHGRAAGASIPHMHSQIVGTPFIPLRVAREGEAFATRCRLCAMETHPLIAETPHYRWIAPLGATFAYQQWIVPKAHGNEMDEPRELAALLQDSARAMLSVGEAFNWAFINFPQQERGHWYVELFPRTAVVAGFELGTGTFINTIDPADTARELAAAAARPSRQRAASRR
jgi:UDPglucose--hexose-1-phosphate uridylyltransferase